MRLGSATALLAGAVFGYVIPAFAQAPRQDAFWARRATGTITLNGVLNEPAWAKAESMVVRYGQDAGVPGSGWKPEAGIAPGDPTFATLKLLVVGNQLYLGARVRDKSIGGSKDFNRFDGFLMSMKDHASLGAPKPPNEYFYVWWFENGTDPQPPGQLPRFKGRWANDDWTIPRTPEQIANWDAVTVVNGLSNSDAAEDVSYTVEMRFNLTPMGYDVTRPQGDIIEWNISIYDCDWFWPIDLFRFSSNRVWWQSPWGLDMWYDEVHIYARPDVNTGSGALPTIRPELYVPNGAAFAAPTVNGTLTEPAWAAAYSFDIRYGDDALRATYPGVGPYRSGQYQPSVNGGMALIEDPADATVKMFFRGDDLYLGFDARDQFVQYYSAHGNPFDRWDGFLVTINEKTLRGPDNNITDRTLKFEVAQNGTAQADGYLATLVGAGNAQVALALKAGTTVDTMGVADTGYTAEMRVHLPALGYPTGLGDGTLWIGVEHMDGDSFGPSSSFAYGNRAWWFREGNSEETRHDCCPIWAYMAPSPPTDAGEVVERLDGYFLAGSYRNPGPRPVIRYALAAPSDVTVELFDVRGRLLQKTALGYQAAGLREFGLGRGAPGSGVYLVRVHVADPETGAQRTALRARMVVVK